jgi:hypothetical protein
MIKTPIPPINFNLFHLCRQVADHVGKDASMVEVCDLKLHERQARTIECVSFTQEELDGGAGSFWDV